jgi:hypothetical protein
MRWSIAVAVVVRQAPPVPPVISISGGRAYFRNLFRRRREDEEQRLREGVLARQAAFAEMARQAQDALNAREKAMIEEDDIEVLTLL